MPGELTQNDHDVLIRLATQMEANAEVMRALLGDLGKLSQKFDQMHDTLIRFENSLRDVQRTQGNFDIRVATLEQQVETLQDEAREAAKVAEALRKSNEKRDAEVEKLIKRFTFVTGTVSFLIATSSYWWPIIQRIFIP